MGSNKKLIVGVNDFETWCKLNNRLFLLDEWDYDINIKNGYKPNNILAHSGTEIWWKCEKGHLYPKLLGERTRKNRCPGCPYCSNQELLYGFNDLETWCIQNHKEHMLKEWDYDKNFPETPKSVLYTSSTKRWWICSLKHSYDLAPNKRIRGDNCPYCSHHKLLKGFNDFETYCKENNLNYLLDEWDYGKNVTLPCEMFPKTSDEVHWKCRFCGNEWKASLKNRVRRKDGCSKCNRNKTSFPEQTILYYLKPYFPDIIHRYRELGFELDIYIPSIKTAIEYDGIAFHSDKQNAEIKKNKLCKDNNITLIRIREGNLCSYNDCVCIFRKDTDNKYSLNAVIEQLLLYLNINFYNIDVLRDYVSILENYFISIVPNSLAEKFSEISKEWHPTKNGSLKPENIPYSANIDVWWQCEHGHEWETSINARTSKNSGCPYCSGRYAIKGETDFETWCNKNNRLDLLDEWLYRENDKLNIFPDNITFRSGKDVWWKCSKCGHEWKRNLDNRFRGRGCPKCAGFRKIRCVETGEVFKNGTLAAKTYGLKNSSHICACCKGKRKTAGGYHWEYAD